MHFAGIQRAIICKYLIIYWSIYWYTYYAKTSLVHIEVPAFLYTHIITSYFSTIKFLSKKCNFVYTKHINLNYILVPSYNSIRRLRCFIVGTQRYIKTVAIAWARLVLIKFASHIGYFTLTYIQINTC